MQLVLEVIGVLLTRLRGLSPELEHRERRKRVRRREATYMLHYARPFLLVFVELAEDIERGGRDDHHLVERVDKPLLFLQLAEESGKAHEGKYEQQRTPGV